MKSKGPEAAEPRETPRLWVGVRDAQAATAALVAKDVELPAPPRECIRVGRRSRRPVGQRTRPDRLRERSRAGPRGAKGRPEGSPDTAESRALHIARRAGAYDRGAAARRMGCRRERKATGRTRSFQHRPRYGVATSLTRPHPPSGPRLLLECRRRRRFRTKASSVSSGGNTRATRTSNGLCART